FGGATPNAFAVMAIFKKANGPSKLRAEIGRQVAARLAANPAVTAVPIPGTQVFYCDNFLDDARCDLLISMIDAHRRPSTLLSDRPDYGFR
ncbi:hypothetical protein ABTL13_19430, partial [Acinetobacter baumannii]